MQNLNWGLVGKVEQLQGLLDYAATLAISDRQSTSSESPQGQVTAAISAVPADGMAVLDGFVAIGRRSVGMMQSFCFPCGFVLEWRQLFWLGSNGKSAFGFPLFFSCPSSNGKVHIGVAQSRCLRRHSRNTPASAHPATPLGLEKS